MLCRFGAFSCFRFMLWNVLFVLVRLGTITLAVLTLWFVMLNQSPLFFCIWHAVLILMTSITFLSAQKLISLFRCYTKDIESRTRNFRVTLQYIKFAKELLVLVIGLSRSTLCMSQLCYWKLSGIWKIQTESWLNWQKSKASKWHSQQELYVNYMWR